MSAASGEGGTMDDNTALVYLAGLALLGWLGWLWFNRRR
jgi:LPXTG-motif cell wall-anchored protein